MAGEARDTCWESNLELHCQDETESLKSCTEEDDNPNETSVGPFFCRLFENQLYTDVDLVCKDTEESISAHRPVLASKSKYFENLLFGDQKNEVIGMKMQVEISDMDFSVLKDILKYFYTGDIYFTSDAYVLDTYAVAQTFEIQTLVDRCEEYLDALELTEDNVCSTLQLSNAKNAKQLKERCIEYIKENTVGVISSPDFEKCSFSTVREICELQDVSVDSEFRLLEAAFQWIDVQPDQILEEVNWFTEEVCWFTERIDFLTGVHTGMQRKVERRYWVFTVFKNIIEYLHTGHIYFSDDSHVLEMYAIVQNFPSLILQSLIDRCEEYLDAMELTAFNVCSLLQLSKAKNHEQRKERCIEYIKENTLLVISFPDFEQCSFSTVREIFELQDLNLDSEFRLLEAALCWIDLQPSHMKKDLEDSLMKCIRFLSLTPREFGDIVRECPELLTSDDALDILMFLNDPRSNNVNKLPDWVNRGHRNFRYEGEPVYTNVRSVKIPLKLASDPQDITMLRSVLRMRCIKGSHKINAIKFSLEGNPKQGNKNAVLVIETLLMPKGHRLRFTKVIDSKETTFVFDRGIFVRVRQTLHLKVEVKACQLCKFLQLDDSKNLTDEHFRFSAFSSSKKGTFFIIDEIEYGPHIQQPRFRNPRRQNISEDTSFDINEV